MIKYQKKTCITLHCLYHYWFCYENGEKKNYAQVYLEDCKYKIKKTKTSKFMNTELESDSGSEIESDTESESKLESGSDSE